VSHAEYRKVECRYAKCHYAERRYAECHGATKICVFVLKKLCLSGEEGIVE
jgi:hypothetical protein